MKKFYLFAMLACTMDAMAQAPTNLGTNAEDGISYQTYNLIDHGVVRSVRFQAQNDIASGVGIWEFFTGDYFHNWRPYFANDTVSGYNAIIDPAVESASARYNSNYGGQSGHLRNISAGYYYTFIISDNELQDNRMNIVPTDFAPVFIDTAFITPTEPTESDLITITVELDQALTLSNGEHVYIRYSTDGFATSQFIEITNFSNGVGTFTLPTTIPAGTTVTYYVVVTAEAAPQHETIDFFTLFFGNNDGNNYSFTVSSVTGIEELAANVQLQVNDGSITLSNVDAFDAIDVISVDGRSVASVVVAGRDRLSVETGSLAKGVYLVQLRQGHATETRKVVVN